MNATFLVTLNIQSEMEIPSISEDMHDELSTSGFDVVEVKPWQRASLDLGQAVQDTFPIQPPEQPLF
jgi:hypothetical protein